MMAQGGLIDGLEGKKQKKREADKLPKSRISIGNEDMKWGYH
jgi:hypothetical protein